MSLESLPNEESYVNISFSDDDDENLSTSSEYIPPPNFGNAKESESHGNKKMDQTTDDMMEISLAGTEKNFSSTQQHYDNPLASFSSHSELKFSNQNSNDAYYPATDVLIGRKFIFTGNVIDRDEWIAFVKEHGGINYNPLQPPANSSSSGATSRVRRVRRKCRTSFSQHNDFNKEKDKAFSIHQDEETKLKDAASDDSALQNRENLYLVMQEGKQIETMKFLFAKALNATPVDVFWIKKCVINAEWKEPPTVVQQSEQQHGTTQLPLSSSSAASQSAQNQSFIFSRDTKIMIRDSPLTFRDQWESLLAEMGAKILSDKDMDQVMELFVILVQTTPSYDTRKISQEYSIPVVNVKYIKHCLKAGRPLPLTEEYAYNAPKDQTGAAIASSSSQDPAGLSAAAESNAVFPMLNAVHGEWTPQKRTKFIGSVKSKDSFGSQYYTQVCHRGVSYSVNDCVRINLHALSLTQQKQIPQNDNIVLIRSIFRSSDDESLLRIQLFSKRCLIDEKSRDNEYELFLSTTIFDGVPIHAIEEKLNILSRKVKCSKKLYYCTHEIDMATENVVPLKNCIWRSPRQVVVLDPEPQEDEDGRATFFSAISFDGVPLFDNMMVQMSTDVGEEHVGRIMEIFQMKGISSDVYNITLQLAEANHDSHELKLKDEDDTVALSTDEICNVSIVKVVKNAQLYRDRDFSGNYWSVT